MNDKETNEEAIEENEKAIVLIDDLIFLVEHQIPYEDWPPVLKIAGLNEELMGQKKDLGLNDEK